MSTSSLPLTTAFADTRTSSRCQMALHRTQVWYLNLSPHKILAALAKTYEQGNDATLHITVPSGLDRALAQEIVSHIIDSAPPVAYDLMWRDRGQNCADKILEVHVEHPSRYLSDSE
ncbi:hypothetical protein [Noviherbaspirillum malthae]|uniref:hypothetical protein n=1 Tax=Noviherbaspirillum malthae TaxID=1260987 RepID=UPI00188F24D0|nr:hypothetical protein [Noviherbaspirillum malthae]